MRFRVRRVLVLNSFEPVTAAMAMYYTQQKAHGGCQGAEAVIILLDNASSIIKEAMSVEDGICKHRIGAMELLGIGGFSFALSVIAASSFWFFAFFPSDYVVAQRCLIKVFQFIGLLMGYLIVHFLADKFKPRAFTPSVLIAASSFFALHSFVMLLSYIGIEVPFFVFCLSSLLTGLASSYFILGWLDICSRSRVCNYMLFTSLSFTGCGLIFLVICLLPLIAQPIFCIALALANIAMFVFVGTRAAESEPVVVRRKEYLRFNREIEPSFFVYGVVFGMAFAFLFCYGVITMIMAMIAVLVGSLLAVTIALVAYEAANNITVLQRVVPCAAVVACAIIPFVSLPSRSYWFCVIVATWAFFTSLNYAILVRRYKDRGLFVFWNIPMCLVVKPLGFLVGWLFTSYVAINLESTSLIATMLGTALILVLVVMVFFPVSEHHDIWVRKEQNQAMPLVLSTDSGDSTVDELLEKRCMAVSDLYQLSPRESETLLFLAKGRNAAYIQNKLTISPNTAKTHIYNIYRKLDIHSQQQIMDFIEGYPLKSNGGNSQTKRSSESAVTSNPPSR